MVYVRFECRDLDLEIVFVVPDTTRTVKHGYRFAKGLLALAATCLLMVSAYLFGSSRKMVIASLDLSNAQMINGVSLVRFRSGSVTDVIGHLAAGSSLPSNRLDLLSDYKLNTGIINPGGSPVPLSTSHDSESSPVSLSFRAIAVGIDLSDLGFTIGESVEGLFFQDAADDEKSTVDPFFIAGLPSLKTPKVNS